MLYLRGVRILISTFIVFMAFVPAADARDNGQYAQISPEIRKWVEGLTDDQGHGCCATADGFKPEQVEWDIQGSRYHVQISGAWYVVPDGALIKGPNRLGFAMVWYSFTDDGSMAIRCFLPGDGA
jgi:hypothetical protein